MNAQDWNTSPIITGQVKKKGTPKQDEDGNMISDGKYTTVSDMMSEDLQKLRISPPNSNHDNTGATREEDAIDDEEHDGIIKGLLYPGLEEEDNNTSFDFFEEDYQMAHASLSSAASSSRRSFSTTGNNSSSRRSSSSLLSSQSSLSSMMPPPGGGLPSHASESSSSSTNYSYERAYFQSTGRRYSDLTQEKLSRR